MAKFRVISGALSGKLTCPNGGVFDGSELPPKEIKELCNRGIIEEVGQTSSGQMTPVLDKPVKGTAVQSKWNLDPKTLEGVSLTNLNAMIADRDKEGKVKPFDKTEEAVAFLTQDFEN